MYGDSTMCATVETIKIKPGKLQESIDIMEKLRSEIERIPGRVKMIDIWNDDGVEYMINIWESPEAKAAAASKVDEIGAQFGDIFEEFKAEDFQNVEFVIDK